MSASIGMSPRGSQEPRGVDLLRLPILRTFLRWKHARISMQIPLGLLAILLIVQGIAGSQLAPKNLATLLVWVHWRGALVIALLVLGNVFCMSCPLLLPREISRRLFRPVRSLPRALRTKWVGVLLLVGVLFAYEAFDIWASPAGTAWLILTYFAVALLVDAFFKGAAFCKWVCPIGQFNFVASTFSPFEVRVRDHSTCGSCRTKDCIRGQRDPQQDDRIVQRGCELGLFLPQKVGNLDCTFCLDCVVACPEDNVALATRVPGEELVQPERRSGIGRLTRRPDYAALVVIFTFGALLNAFGMVGPVYTFQTWLSEVLGTRSEGLVLAVLFAMVLVVLPLLSLGLVGLWVRKRTGIHLRQHLTAFAYSLAPLGFGVWLAHYSFHFLTGLWTFVPVAQHTLLGYGVTVLGRPDWGAGGLSEAQVWPLEVGFLALGVLGSIAVTWRLAKRDAPQRPSSAFAPWALLHVSLLGMALWLLAQPMEMRGTYL